MGWLTVWLQHAKIEDGALFRRLVGSDNIGGALNPGSIAPIFKRVAQWIGVPEYAEKIHAARSGMARAATAGRDDLGSEEW